jgi:hypothetical protein
VQVAHIFQITVDGDDLAAHSQEQAAVAATPACDIQDRAALGHRGREPANLGRRRRDSEMRGLFRLVHQLIH